MLDGSIHDGIITHGVYIVTIMQENFKRTEDQMLAMSSQDVHQEEIQGSQVVWAALILIPGYPLRVSVSLERFSQ